MICNYIYLWHLQFHCWQGHVLQRDLSSGHTRDFLMNNSSTTWPNLSAGDTSRPMIRGSEHGRRLNWNDVHYKINSIISILFRCYSFSFIFWSIQVNFWMFTYCEVMCAHHACMHSHNGRILYYYACFEFQFRSCLIDATLEKRVWSISSFRTRQQLAIVVCPL